ncbi:MAG: hypothetical protein KJZ72_06485 [Anaerolineales bacterium]|nr:hypothetical protein [Anaerolineales bacterium]
MKSTKWIGWTLGILLAFIVLAGVGFAGFRFGMMRSIPLADGTFPRWAERFDGDMPHRFEARDFGRGHHFAMHGFDRGGLRLFSPILWMLRLVVIGGLLWLGFSLFKNSGWRLVNINATQAATVTPTPTPSAQGDEKKDEA